MTYLIYFTLSFLGALAALALFGAILYLLEDNLIEGENYNGR